MDIQVPRCLGRASGIRFSGMLLMIAAAPHEFAGFPGLVKCDLPGVRWSAITAMRGATAILVANGAGRFAAVGTRRALVKHRIRAVVSTGFAGALDPSLGVGEIFLANTVLCDDRKYRGSVPLDCPPDVRCGSLLTVDEVVQSSSAKRELAKRGAHAVDMEAAAVAAVASEHGLPFFCVRAISDHAGQDLPVDFNRALRPDGTFSPWSVLGQAVAHTGTWFELLQLWREARLAAQSLAHCLSRCEFRS